MIGLYKQAPAVGAAVQHAGIMQLPEAIQGSPLNIPWDS